MLTYVAAPLFGTLVYRLHLIGGLFAIAVIGISWLSVLGWSVAGVTHFASKRAWAWLTATAVAVVLAAVGFVVVDWEGSFVTSLYRLHRAEFAELGRLHDAGKLPQRTVLPLKMRYLSVDSGAHVVAGKIYLPTSLDFAEEQGAGYIYSATRPQAGGTIGSKDPAIPYHGLPSYEVVSLGDGWWWAAN